MNMIEKVARSIANCPDDEMIDPKVKWENCDNGMRQDYMREAKAAIEAMREPTEEIRTIVARTIETSASLPNHMARADLIIKAMIDAALKE